MSGNENVGKITEIIKSNKDLTEYYNDIAKSLSDLIENEVIFLVSDKDIQNILLNEETSFPEPTKLAHFFLTLFEKRPEMTKYYFELIPFDKLSKDSCLLLEAKLSSIGLVEESRKMRKLSKVYQMILCKKDEFSNVHAKYMSLTEQLSSSTELLEKITDLLRRSSNALMQTTKELENKQKEIDDTDDLIQRYMYHKPGKR